MQTPSFSPQSVRGTEPPMPEESSASVPDTFHSIARQRKKTRLGARPEEDNLTVINVDKGPAVGPIETMVPVLPGQKVTMVPHRKEDGSEE